MGYYLIEDDDLKTRLQRCIEIRHKENTQTELVKQAFAKGDQNMMKDILRSMIDQASALVCLCDLAGLTPEEVLRRWVQMMEDNHPAFKKADG